MILILTNQAVFVTLSVVTIPPLVQGIFILTLNHANVIGDQLDGVTQNAWFRCALCAAVSEISTFIQTGAESSGRFPVPRICRWENTLTVTFCNVSHFLDNEYTFYFLSLSGDFYQHNDKHFYDLNVTNWCLI